MAEMLPGAEAFTAEARQAVVAGPLFDQQKKRPYGKPYYENTVGQCVINALGKHDPEGVQAIHIDAFLDFVARNDRGDYADRANLRRDLLGDDRAPQGVPQ